MEETRSRGTPYGIRGIYRPGGRHRRATRTTFTHNTWECPRESKNAGTPCFVPGTPLDVSQLDLLEKAPGRARSVEIRLSGSECGPTYGTILMRARNAFGASAFTIVDAALVPDPRDIIC
jgi:hypothetical protein